MFKAVSEYAEGESLRLSYHFVTGTAVRENAWERRDFANPAAIRLAIDFDCEVAHVGMVQPDNQTYEIPSAQRPCRSAAAAARESLPRLELTSQRLTSAAAARLGGTYVLSAAARSRAGRTAAPLLRPTLGGHSDLPFTLDLAFPAAVAQLRVMRLTAECYTFLAMKLVTGTVENGKVVLPEGEFEEGAAVAVLASTPDEPVRLTAAEEEALIESLAEIRSGNYVTGVDLLQQLRSRGR